MTACHSYTGVAASIDGSDPVIITITHDGCQAGRIDTQTTECGEPMIDHQQAWTVAMLLTRREAIRPAGEPFWDASARRMSFPLRSDTRARIS